jgi:hypothetical protein
LWTLDMHDTWHTLRWAWSAVVIVYCVLGIFASRRLRGRAKKLNHGILIVMVVLVAVRITIQRVFGGGLAYRSAVVVVGITAGVAALIVAKMLITQESGDEAVAVDDKEERIQSLKLS